VSIERFKLILAVATVNLLTVCATLLALAIGPWGKTEEASSFGLGALVQALATALVIGITELFKYIRGEPPTKQPDEKA
jgi:formate hydrogenlyase subunit 4